jgi:hypothetical protein
MYQQGKSFVLAFVFLDISDVTLAGVSLYIKKKSKAKLW